MIHRRLSESFSPWGDVWVRSGWRVQTHCITAQARTLNPHGMRIASGPLEACIGVAAKSAPTAHSKNAAILLHGLWDYPGIMSPIAQALQADGYAVANLSYPSTRSPITAHGAAASHAARALAEDGAEQISFIGHSLGGLVARTPMANAQTDGWRPGRLILIGSPASGSTVAHHFRKFPGYRSIVGACSDTVTPAGAITVAPPICADVLVIAGGTGRHGYNPLIPGDNDGLIAVSETRLPDHETAFLRLASLHRSLAIKPETITACRQFLRTGDLPTK